jgi:hypothetical protein
MVASQYPLRRKVFNELGKRLGLASVDSWPDRQLEGAIGLLQEHYQRRRSAMDKVRVLFFD